MFCFGLSKRISKLEKEMNTVMSALDDLKAGQAAIDKAVQDAVVAIKALADKIASFGDAVTAADAEAVATDLNTVATNLEAAVNPTPPTT